jgi:hypothetical protein
MPTETQRKARRHFDVSSERMDEVLPVLNLFFGEGASYTCWYIDERGFHLAALGDGHAFIPEGRWQHRDRPMAHLPMIAQDIVKWLEGLSWEDKRQINKSWPTEEAYMRDPGIDLVGWRATSSRSEDGQHYMLTFTPAWV